MVTLILYMVAIFNFLYTGIFLTDMTNWFGLGWVVRSEWRNNKLPSDTNNYLAQELQ